MKIRVLIGLLSLSLAFSCQDKKESGEKTAQESTETSAKEATSVQLANYSDDNWSNGVGITFKMLLVDYSEEKFQLLSKGTELTLPSGQKLPYVGIEKQGNYIQILLNEKPTTYQAAVEYPNEITVK